MKQLQWIDKTKTFAIILVVAAHAMIPAIRNQSMIIYYLRQIIYMFHMPLFMVLSGYLFELNIEKYIKKGFGDFVKNKAIKLMLPYLCISIISYVGIGICMKIPVLSTMLYDAGYEGRDLFTAVKEIVLLTNHMDEHMWFIYTLFVIFIIEFLLHKACMSKVGIVVQVIAYLFFTMLDMPEIFSRVCMYTIYFTLGRILTHHKTETVPSRGVRCGQWVTVVIMIVATLYFNSHDSVIRNNPFLYMFVRRIMSLCTGTVCVITVINLFAAHQNSDFKRNGCLKMICDNEYGIYLLHQPFIVSGVVGILCTINNTFPIYYIYVLFGTVTGIFIPIFLCEKIINKISPLALLITGRLPRKYKEK